MAIVKIIGKAGVFLVLAKGRLASEAQVHPTLAEALNNVTAGDSVQFDAGAVALIKIEIGGM